MDHINKRDAVLRLAQLMEGGLLESLLQEITNDLALEIVETFPEETEKREDLYMLNKALKRLNEKLQEYVNNYNSQGENE